MFRSDLRSDLAGAWPPPTIGVSGSTLKALAEPFPQYGVPLRQVVIVVRQGSEKTVRNQPGLTHARERFGNELGDPLNDRIVSRIVSDAISCHSRCERCVNVELESRGLLDSREVDEDLAVNGLARYSPSDLSA